MMLRKNLHAHLFISALMFALSVPAWAETSAVEAVTAGELREIRNGFRDLGLRQADVSVAEDGRVSLIGEYENRDEVETAFSATRAVVGLRRVAPTTPANIKYRLKGFDSAFAATIGKMMQKPSVKPTPQTPPKKAESIDRGPQSFGLVIGVGRYKYLPDSKSLEGADKDARDFYDMLTASDGAGIPRDAVHLLVQEKATASAVKAAMQEILDKTQANDTVVFFAATHGLPNAMNKFDIVLYDTEFPRQKAGSKEQGFEFVVANRKTALSDDDFQDFTSKLTLKNVRTVLVLDTCYSGKTFAAIPGYLSTRTRTLSVRKKEAAYTTAMPQQALSELAQQAKDLQTTRIVIVSASEDEESMEAPNLGGGAFTQTYVRQLRKIHDFADAFDQTRNQVIKIARTVGHSQTPRMLVIPEAAVTKM